MGKMQDRLNEMSSPDMCGMFGPEHFLTLDKDQLDALTECMSMSHKAKQIRHNPGYKDEHLKAFREANLTWPPANDATAIIDPWGLSQRQLEVVHYLHACYKPSWHNPDNEIMPKHKFEFCDVNPTLTRITGSLAPWKPHVQTLTGHAKPVVRWQVCDTIHIKALRGYEMMSLIGWPFCMYKGFAYGKPGSLPDSDLLANLSGNAYSAFAFGPVAICALAAGGAIARAARAGAAASGHEGNNESDNNESESEDSDVVPSRDSDVG